MSISLSIRRVDCSRADAADVIGAIRTQLSPRGDVVSSRGRQLTLEVFGEPLSPRQVVVRICTEVEEKGLAAVLDYTRKLDKVDLTPQTLRVSREELAAAHRAVSEDYLQAIRQIAANIRRFQEAILHRDVILAAPDHELRLLYRPLRRVGICIPGGAAAYPSTLLMTAVPAQVAGVEELVVVAPPTPFGAYNAHLLAACQEVGIEAVYRIGGAQAVAAMACGIDGLGPVDKIAGPGNLFVALAKQYVSERVGIDMIAGPTEVVVLADHTANPHFLAADLISQAEHAPGASILITWAPGVVEQVARSLEVQLGMLDRGELARESLESYGALIEAAGEEEACRLANAVAPEHLQVQTADPEQTARRIRNAGAIFLGHDTPVAVGDYVAGPSHTLPTGGTARFHSGLSANDFLRRTSVIRFGPARLQATVESLRTIAQTEGLTAHSHSVEIRLQPELLARVDQMARQRTAT